MDAGEDPDHAGKREFLEEAMDSENASDEEKEKLQAFAEEIFNKGEEVSSWYLKHARVIHFS